LARQKEIEALSKEVCNILKPFFLLVQDISIFVQIERLGLIYPHYKANKFLALSELVMDVLAAVAILADANLKEVFADLGLKVVVQVAFRLQLLSSMSERALCLSYDKIHLLSSQICKIRALSSFCIFQS